MKLHAAPIQQFAVSKLTETSLSVGTLSFKTSLQIHPNFGAIDWNVTSIDNIREEDVLQWIAQKPELVILGTGKTHRMLGGKLQVKLAQAGIGFECMTTAAAARTYNVVLDEGRDVLGAFIFE